ncbi:MAG: hypothetical protein QXH27_04740 [Candidatus Micrarchaeia archaeon]
MARIEAGGKRARAVAAEGFSLKNPRWAFFTLLWSFSALAVAFSVLPLGRPIWPIIAALALAFFALEVRLQAGRLDFRLKAVKNALYAGVAFLVLAVAAQAAGESLGLWKTRGSYLALGPVPAELALAAFFGGAGWALYLPRKKDVVFSAFDTALFAIFGTLGEWVLAFNGLLAYGAGWGYPHAFASYVIAWAVLHWARYEFLG